MKGYSPDLRERVINAVRNTDLSQAEIARVLRTLNDVGLGYIKLGQSATTINGAEAQPIKLAVEMSRVATGRTVYMSR